ncbi:uncharacterized protein LOC133192830 [Saccostrea echinata]|uniref:uncharacterized protein LOC133192830 n=1 Tax=Saccostrea echinata TaxID=191078 RepID=UPI002A829F6F|nr:uncharacterized protein LOC133192830 [Saccostrea echinata]
MHILQVAWIFNAIVFTTGIPRCKEGFVNVANWCFSFHRKGATFAKSVEICEESGGEMVILDSQEKEMALTNYMEAQNFSFNLAIPNREVYPFFFFFFFFCLFYAYKCFSQQFSIFFNFIFQFLRKSHMRLKAADEYADKFCEFYKKYNDSVPSSKLYISNAKIPVEFNKDNRANLTTPPGFSIKRSSIPNAGLGAWAETHIPIYRVIGIYEGEEFFDDGDHLYAWILNSGDEDTMTHFVDGASPAKSNWLRYVNCPRNYKEENVHSVICDDLVFYMTSQVVMPDTELLVWYGGWYGYQLGIRNVHPEDDLDLDDVFYVRVSYLNQDYPGKFSFHDNTTVIYTNWNPKQIKEFNEDEYWEHITEPFGLLLSHNKGQWSWVPEKDYSYFTGEGGLLLPFVCEHKSNVKQ